MISPQQLERAFERQDDERLLDLLVQNGLPMTLPLRMLLLRAQPAVAALGMRRLLQLERRVSPTSRQMLKMLTGQQVVGDGGDADDTAEAVEGLMSPTKCGGLESGPSLPQNALAVSAVTAALRTYLQFQTHAQVRTGGLFADSAVATGAIVPAGGNSVRELYVQQLEQLSGAQSADGLLQLDARATDIERLAGTALAFCLLADDPAALGRLDLDAMLRALEKTDDANLRQLTALGKIAMRTTENCVNERTNWACAA